MDRFVRDRLPPDDLWPEMDYSSLPELAYGDTLNCAVELLDQMVETGFGGNPVLHFGDLTWSYAELKDKADRIAAVLTQDLNLAPGNRVLLRGTNAPMMIASWFGTIKAGGIAVATMPMLRTRELRYILDKAAITHALCDASIGEELALASDQVQTLQKILHFSADGGEAASLEQAMAKKEGGFENVETEAAAPVLIAFTSGTTGTPKGTVHAHRDVMAMCDTFARHILGVRPDDVFVGSPPLAFTFGLGALVAFPMRFGASTALVERFGPSTMLETIEKHRCSCIFTAPTAYRVMLSQLDDFDISSMRVCVSAGEHLPEPVWQAWHEATGIKIVNGIGATEMLHIFISAAGDDIRPGATGKVVPGYQARIVDEIGAEKPIGEDGWLAVKGPTGCRYLDDIERQRKYVKNGWNITGDIYRQDEDGYFWYVTRGDDMIVSAGYNIAGPEVETCLQEHPNVLECAVVGAPDPNRGCIVKAFVVLAPQIMATAETVRELQDFVKGRLAPYKYPRAIEFLDDLPKTATGKLQRFRLQQNEPETSARKGNAA